MGDFCCQAFVLLILSFPFVTLPWCSRHRCAMMKRSRSILLKLTQSFSVLCYYGYPKMEPWGEGSGDCYVWDGVECNQDTGRVSHFPSNSPLSSLQTLNLASNNFSYSQIPLAFSHLDKLKTLNLSNSGLTGQIPSQIPKLSSLSTLDLSANHGLFSHNNTFLVLKKLTCLDVSGVNLMSRSEISSINSSSPRLKILSLEYLPLSWNNIEGNIPQWFVDTAEESMLFLDLSCNNLDICWKLLEDLDLSGNRLHGPESICNTSSLKVLDLSDITMSGPIRECLGNQLAQSLQDLNKQANNLSGRVPPTSNKTLEGNLPRWLANCEMLEVLDIERNNINDIFPSWLASLLQVVLSWYFQQWQKMKEHVYRVAYSARSTIVIPLSGERYVGSEEYTYSISMTWKHLELVFPSLIIVSKDKLSNNSLIEGCIPSSTGKLVELESLDLSQNMLSGRIPRELLGLTYLEEFDVSHNKLVGSYEGNLRLCGPPLSNNAEQAKAVSQSSAELLDSDEHNNTSELVEWMVRLAGYISGFVIGFSIGKIYVTDRNHAWFVDTVGKTKSKRRHRRSWR